MTTHPAWPIPPPSESGTLQLQLRFEKGITRPAVVPSIESEQSLAIITLELKPKVSEALMVSTWSNRDVAWLNHSFHQTCHSASELLARSLSAADVAPVELDQAWELILTQHACKKPNPLSRRPRSCSEYRTASSQSTGFRTTACGKFLSIFRSPSSSYIATGSTSKQS